MARQLKPLEVDEVYDEKTTERIKIYLDRNENDFFFEDGDKRVRDDTSYGAKQKAVQALEERRKFTWKPFILVDKVENSPLWHGRSEAQKQHAKVEMEFCRVELAQRPDGTWIQRPFLTKEELTDADLARDPQTWKTEATFNRERRERGQDIHGYYLPTEKNPSHFRLDYNEATWAALMAIRERILKAHKQLSEIVGSKDFEKKLLLVASNLKLLPEGKK